ncbi:hypothetical protein H0H81_009274 [Sphagnurus paluster]|uniref:Uncharacterized protein n=1 Tax=Sphagnurus paluster TaxID=117069 RepID=A0A9P7GVR4_9AGAR|nr:hypothetical protein H0H81_009274 [Sphagnurus paluster]
MQVTAMDVMANISMLFGHGAGLEVPQSHVGHTLALDEIAGGGRSCYLSKTDEMAGLCHKHVHKLSSIKMGLDLTLVLAAAQAVKDDKVHIRKEFTVASISAHVQKNYSAKPVLLSPTCKQGTWQESESVIKIILTAWASSPVGECYWGLIWEIASDGDATRQAGLQAGNAQVQ